MTHLVIAVAGISGSGKSTVARLIEEHFGSDKCQIISSDNYYREQHGVSFEERCKTNYDIPESLELNLLASDLSCLRNGKTASIPQYDFATHSRFKAADNSEIRQIIKPREITIVDGILILHPLELQKQFDLRVFVDTPVDVAENRRIARDVAERGRNYADAKKQYDDYVFESQKIFVLPHKAENDMLIVANGINYPKDDVKIDMRAIFDAIQAKRSTPVHSNVHAFGIFRPANTAINEPLPAVAIPSPSFSRHTTP